MNNLIFIDLETTGTNTEMDEIIEVGAVKVKDNKVVDEFCSFVNPKRKLTKDIIGITGIQDDNLKGAPEISEVMTKLKDFIKDYPLLAHNMDFDAAFLKKAGLHAEFLDSLELSCMLFPLEKKHTQQYLLSNLCGVNYDAHRALEDAKNLLILYRKLLERANEMDERVKGEIRECLQKSSWQFKDIFDFPSQGEDKYLTKAAQKRLFCPKRLPNNPNGVPLAHLMSWLFYTATGNLTEMSYWIRSKYKNFFNEVDVKVCDTEDYFYFNQNERLF